MDLYGLAIRARTVDHDGDDLVAQVRSGLRVEAALPEPHRHVPFVVRAGNTEPTDVPHARRQRDRHRSGGAAVVRVAVVFPVRDRLRRADAKRWLAADRCYRGPTATCRPPERPRQFDIVPPRVSGRLCQPPMISRHPGRLR